MGLGSNCYGLSGLSARALLGQALLDAGAAVGGGESGQGKGAEVVPARTAVVRGQELQAPQYEQENGWQGSEGLGCRGDSQQQGVRKGRR